MRSFYAAITSHRRKSQGSGGTILDSCVLIDGRIEAIVASGFIQRPVYIPPFIVAELQTLVDGRNEHKRIRALAGLEAASRLVKDPSLDVKVLPGEQKLIKQTPVDDQLLEMCRLRKANLCTTDVELQKRAIGLGIGVLNPNVLSQAVTRRILPGETFSVRLQKKGENPNQAIGYLNDGVLVVVDGGAKYIGKIVTVVAQKSLQTATGRMVFARFARIE